MKHPSASPDSIKDQAAAWVLREDRGFSPAEQDQFLQWLAADPRHKAELVLQRENWRRLDVLGQWRPEHGQRPNRDLLAPQQSVTARRRRIVFSCFAGLAAAAALVFVATARLPRIQDAEPERAALPIASIQTLALPDGSTVELNRGASIATLYTPQERRVLLERGEAHFTVTKNAARPFVVSAGGIDVRAVGTAFNVRLGRQAVEVLVTEGKVRVDQSVEGGTRPTEVLVNELVRGQRSVVSLADRAAVQVAPVSDDEMEQLLAWQPRTIDITAAPLRAVVAEFNRRNAPVHLVIVDPDLAEVEVSASLRSDNIEGFIWLLEAGFAVKAERAGEEIRLSR